MTPEHDPFESLRTVPAEELASRLEVYAFTDEQGHPLRNCAEFMELLRRATLMQGRT